jgi:hypothetical protein
LIAAFVLICNLNAACDLEHADDVLRVPGQYALPIACLREAQAYFSGIEYPMPSGAKVRFVCRRRKASNNIG